MPETATDNMLSQSAPPIGTMIFNNPARHNAVSSAMWARAAAIMQGFTDDPDIRVVVVTGAGGKAFVSGADISKFEDERANAAAEEVYHANTTAARDKLVNCPKPTIAKIRGYCIGGGVATALGCDIRICSDNSRFAVPAAKLGVGYDYDGIRRLVDVVGPSFAKEIFFTARQFSATEAKQMGLVDRIVPAEELDDYVNDYALTIASNAPMTMHAAKTSILESLKDPADRDLALCERLVDDCHASQDYQEGRMAFMEKRKPNFTGR
jgi:enoyl-CoA hydratase/carnithine racemase